MSASGNPAAGAGAALLFEHYQQVLRRRVRSLVDTSDANVEDACMFAWTQFLSHELDNTQAAHSWLTTVAIRQAVRLERRSRRDLQIVVAAEDGNEDLEPVDPRDELRLRQLLADAGEVIRGAKLSERQAQVLGMQVVGYTYDEMSKRTGDSRRTIERQILTARRRLAMAIAGSRG